MNQAAITAELIAKNQNWPGADEMAARLLEIIRRRRRRVTLAIGIPLWLGLCLVVGTAIALAQSRPDPRTAQMETGSLAMQLAKKAAELAHDEALFAIEREDHQKTQALMEYWRAYAGFAPK